MKNSVLFRYGKIRCRYLGLLSLILVVADIAFLLKADQTEAVITIVIFIYLWCIPLHRFIKKRNKKHAQELSIKKAEQ